MGSYIAGGSCPGPSGKKGGYRWQRSVAAPSYFVQRLVPYIEDSGSAKCQSIGRATCAGADCDALCVLQMLPQSWTSNQLQCSLTFKTAAPATRCLCQVPCTSRWQPIPAVQCRYILCRAAAKHENIRRPNKDSQSRTYDGTVSKCVDEDSGEKETGADPSALCMRLLNAQRLHISVLTNFSGHLSTAQKGRKEGSRFLQVFLGCMCRTSNGHGTDAGTSRKTHGVDEEKLLHAAAEALHERMGSSKGMGWCMDVIQKSFMQRKKCPELPTVRLSTKFCFT